ncbi:SANT/Myb-like DNA-binding domain-containing protein [Nocardia sp. NPDC127526]|uniref:SANT/Myb-like DNA-binding domain-containing protein n=1 Tax=Nocardia sp. NPDC127526 TaxID=3345393 RepID=UPI00362C7979
MEVLRTVVVFAASVVFIGFGAAVAHAFTPQEELRFLLLKHQHQSDNFKAISAMAGHKTCAEIDRYGQGRKAFRIAFDRMHPETNVALNGMTVTEIDILTYCPQHMLPA